MNILESIRRQGLKEDIPEFRVGDTVKVYVTVREGQKTRAQVFAGVVIDRKGSHVEEAFTVRKMSGGVAVERVFPLHSPTVERIEVTRRGRVRKARLNYLRERTGKAARIAERRDVAKPKSK
jgi:large subunit ribosomal protein L19